MEKKVLDSNCLSLHVPYIYLLEPSSLCVITCPTVLSTHPQGPCRVTGLDPVGAACWSAGAVWHDSSSFRGHDVDEWNLIVFFAVFFISGRCFSKQHKSQHTVSPLGAVDRKQKQQTWPSVSPWRLRERVTYKMKTKGRSRSRERDKQGKGGVSLRGTTLGQRGGSLSSDVLRWPLCKHDLFSHLFVIVAPM